MGPLARQAFSRLVTSSRQQNKVLWFSIFMCRVIQEDETKCCAVALGGLTEDRVYLQASAFPVP